MERQLQSLLTEAEALLQRTADAALPLLPDGSLDTTGAAAAAAAPLPTPPSMDGQLASLLIEAEALLQQTAEAAMPLLADGNLGTSGAAAATRVEAAWAAAGVAAAGASSEPREPIVPALGTPPPAAGLPGTLLAPQRGGQLWGARDLGACLESICCQLEGTRAGLG